MSLPLFDQGEKLPQYPGYPRLKPGLLVIPLSSDGSHASQFSPTTVEMKNSDEFYIGESTEGVYIPSDPYLSIVRGCDGRHSTLEIAQLCSIPHGFVLYFLDELRQYNFIEILKTPPKDPGLDELAKHYSERIAPELHLYTWRAGSFDGGEAEVTSRKYFSILILGQNRLARTLLANLQASGFSQTKILSPITQSGARIEARDICGLITKPIDIGRKHIDFHKQIALDSQLTQLSQEQSSDVHLVISTSVISSEYIQRWISEGVPHLQIFQPTSHTLEIGPLVIPGSQACLNCVQLHRRDFLPAFLALSTVASQREAREKREMTSAATSFAAGVLTPYICEYAAQGTSSLMSHSLTIDLLEPLHGIREHHWNIHPECGCGSSNSLISLVQ